MFIDTLTLGFDYRSITPPPPLFTQICVSLFMTRAQPLYMHIYTCKFINIYTFTHMYISKTPQL